MALDNLQLGYLIDPAFQIENLAGKPAVGGSICVFEAGTDTKVITYQDFDGNVNPFKIPLHSDGRAVILADPSRKYDFYVYDSFNNLMFSRLNVTPNLSGNISITGNDVYIYNTDGTLDITQQSIQNNIRRYEINTKHKSLGVEAPLYFVEDSDSATIIGFSGDNYATKDYVDSATSGFLTDRFEYDDNNNITAYNHSAFAGGGANYEAGDNIDITNNRISVTGLPDSADIENAISSAVTSIEHKFEYNANNYITAYNNSAFAGKEYSAGDYVNIENDTINVTGLQPSGDYATKSELESATSGKMDVTGMTAYQPTGDYATHDDLTAYQPAGDYYSASNPSGFITNDAITGLQPSGDYATHDDLTAYATTSLVSSVSSTITGMIPTSDYELVAGSGVELVDDPTAKTTTINVTAEGTPVTAIEQMIESATSGLQPSGDYATTADLTAKQDTLDYGYHDAAISSIDSAALYDTSAHARINTLAGRISNLSSDKLDTTAFSEVSGDFYTTANPSGFISEVPDTYLQNTDLSTSDGKVTAISGIPLSAGGDIPEGVMSESGLEYNAVNEISGYNGSAIAQYGAEKQWLVHDDTLVHAANSAQYALGVNLSAVAQLLGIDETVLWEGSDPLDQSCLVNGTRETATLSEPLSSFDKIRIYAVWNPWIGNFTGCNTFEYPGTNGKGGYIMNDCTNQGFIAGGTWSANGTTFKLIKHWQANYPAAKETSNGLGGIFKIVGIGRKN